MIRLLALIALATVAFAELDSSIKNTESEGTNGEERFLFTLPSVGLTKSLLTITTTTTSLAAATFCYNIIAGIAYTFATTGVYTPVATDPFTTTIESIPNCRKRRWAFEDPIDGTITNIESASAPIVSSLVEEQKQKDAAEDVAETLLAVEENLEKTEENLEKAEENGEGRLFIKNPLNVQKVTQTLTAVSVVTTQIQTKTIQLTCTPLNFSMRQC
ncbi:hypothetical protein QYM36_001091 [Artemia franciscana]|uniref:Uncharacterized protein n=1 Tax=Artemia franciscana TaxID=6661 RepID=A0AA88LBN0_ARTSF|nr:hypothetical protein QYM36_001091 [Artemia franciscana]